MSAPAGSVAVSFAIDPRVAGGIDGELGARLEAVAKIERELRLQRVVGRGHVRLRRFGVAAHHHPAEPEDPVAGHDRRRRPLRSRLPFAGRLGSHRVVAVLRQPEVNEAGASVAERLLQRRSQLSRPEIRHAVRVAHEHHVNVLGALLCFELVKRREEGRVRTRARRRRAGVGDRRGRSGGDWSNARARDRHGRRRNRRLLPDERRRIERVIWNRRRRRIARRRAAEGGERDERDEACVR